MRVDYFIQEMIEMVNEVDLVVLSRGCDLDRKSI